MADENPERTAVYAGSFDLLTNGHMWMIERGAELFDHLIVAAGINPDKNYMFDLHDRERMLEEATDHLDIETTLFGARYLVKFAKESGANYILRGIRNQKDFGYESSMLQFNNDIEPEIETVFFMPPSDLAKISSSIVKGLIGPEGWQEVVRQYVPESVFLTLKEIYDE